MRTLWFLALNLFSAALIAQDPVMNLLRTSYITQREIEVDLGKENFVVHQSFLIGANQDKLFGSTLFNTTLYHYQRRKECYTNSLMVACQLPLYVKGDTPDKFNMLFGDLATSLNISSNLTGIASGLTTNYLKADDLAKILDNKISQFLRRINPKSVDGVKISPTNLQKLSKALKIIKLTTISVDFAFNAAVREALATDLALARLDVLEDIVLGREADGIPIDQALKDSFFEARLRINKSEDYFGALAIELTERESELRSLALDEALLYFKKHYLTQALTKYYATHSKVLVGRSAAANASTLAGLYAFSVLVTYEVIDALLDQHEKAQTAITSATLYQILSQETEKNGLQSNDIITAMRWQLQYDYYSKMQQAYSGLLPWFRDQIDNVVLGEKFNKEWRIYYRDLGDEINIAMQGMQLYFLDPADESDEPGSDNVYIGFIIDSSGSMKQNDPLNIRKSALYSIIDILDDVVDIFIVDFDHRAELINPNNYRNFDRDVLKNQVRQKIDSEGGTEIGLGLDCMRIALEDKIPENPRAAMLVLSDGVSDYNDEALWFAINNIPVYTVSYKDMGNGALLQQIATSTNGTYLKANNEEDIIEAFLQFYNQLLGFNKYVSKKGTIAGKSGEIHEFIVDAETENLITYIGYQGTLPEMTLRTPAGNIVSTADARSEWIFGDNYTSIKLDEPQSGKWAMDLSNQSKDPIEYIFEASGKSPLDIALKKVESPGGNSEYSIISQKGSLNPDELKPVIKLLTPDGKILDISSSFAGGRFQYYPYSGSGNYTVNVQLSGKDLSGKEFTRFFSASDFIGETGKFFTGIADYAIGSFVQTSLGKNNGNYEGMACKLFRQGSSGLIQVGKGTVTWVGPDKCHVEILEFLNGAWGANVGDVIQLDPVMWKRDK